MKIMIELQTVAQGRTSYISNMQDRFLSEGCNISFLRLSQSPYLLNANPYVSMKNKQTKAKADPRGCSSAVVPCFHHCWLHSSPAPCSWSPWAGRGHQGFEQEVDTGARGPPTTTAVLGMRGAPEHQ